MPGQVNTISAVPRTRVPQAQAPVGGSWRRDETYIKVKGVWKYLYRAVAKEGKTVDFLLTAKRDKAAAKRFFGKALRESDVPEKSPWIKAVPTKRRSLRSMQQKYSDRRSSGQISQQHRRAGPSCDQTCHQTDAQLSRLSISPKCPGWHRAHAHDSQRPTHDRGGHPDVFCRSILCVGRIHSPRFGARRTRSSILYVFLQLTRQNPRRRLVHIMLCKGGGFGVWLHDPLPLGFSEYLLFPMASLPGWRAADSPIFTGLAGRVFGEHVTALLRVRL